jgi:hypothetical protein
MMDEEEAVRIVFLLDREKPGIILAPVLLLPVLIEEACLRDIGAGVGVILRISAIA